MVYYEYLKPVYHRQKEYYKKAYYSVVDSDKQKIYTLYSDRLKDGFKMVAQIVIDKKHQSKNRYYLAGYKDSLTLWHIYDFIYQFYEHKTTKKKLFTRNIMNKDKLFKYALELN